MKDLLAAVVAKPDDDAARLVYADALQAAGDPRGELIAVQCELARLGWDAERLFLDWIGDERVDCGALDDGHFARLRRREAELFRDHNNPTWWEPTNAGGGGKLKRPKLEIDMFRRGFVEHIAANASQTIDELLAIAPLLRSVRTMAWQPHILKKFFASPDLDRIRELWWASSIAEGMLPYFAGCRSLDNLRHLILHHSGGPHVLTTLAAVAPFFRNLEVLTLYSFSLDAAAILAVFARSLNLRELQIVDSRMGAAAAQTLVDTGELDRLRIFALRHARLNEGEAGVLFKGTSLGIKGKRWSALEALDLRTNKLGAWDAAAIGDLPALRVLDLSNQPQSFGAPGIEALVDAKRTGLTKLRSLALQKTGLDDHAVKALADSKLFARLRVLDLRGNRITEKGIRALVRDDGRATQLRVLYIGGNPCGPKGKKLLKAALPNTRLY